MARGNTELVELVRGAALASSATTVITKELPVGEAWTRLLLRINQAVTIGTGAGAEAEGELRVIRGVTLKTDRGPEMPVVNCPGRFLYRKSQQKNGVPGARDVIAAASATYRVPLMIWFVDSKSIRPEDTIFDTSRYQTLTLEITMGAIGDLITTPGTATVTFTVDIYAERVRGRLDAAAKPKHRIEYGVMAPVNPTSIAEIDVLRAADLWYKRLDVFTSSAALTGVPFSGVASNGVMNDVTLFDGDKEIYSRVLEEFLRRFNQEDLGYESVLTGYYLLNLMQDGSVQSALYTGDRSQLKVKWTNNTSPPTAPQVSVGYEAIRPLAV